MNQLENKDLPWKIQKVKELMQDLGDWATNNEADGDDYYTVVSQFLGIMANMFEDVEKRLTELEKKQETNHA